MKRSNIKDKGLKPSSLFFAKKSRFYMKGVGEMLQNKRAITILLGCALGYMILSIPGALIGAGIAMYLIGNK